MYLLSCISLFWFVNEDFSFNSFIKLSLEIKLSCIFFIFSLFFTVGHFGNRLVLLILNASIFFAASVALFKVNSFRVGRGVLPSVELCGRRLFRINGGVKFSDSFVLLNFVSFWLCLTGKKKAEYCLVEGDKIWQRLEDDKSTLFCSDADDVTLDRSDKGDNTLRRSNGGDNTLRSVGGDNILNWFDKGDNTLRCSDRGDNTLRGVRSDIILCRSVGSDNTFCWFKKGDSTFVELLLFGREFWVIRVGSPVLTTAHFSTKNKN